MRPRPAWTSAATCCRHLEAARSGRAPVLDTAASHSLCQAVERGWSMTRPAEPCDHVCMAFSRIAENRIKEAMAQGQFENLPGAGQPLNLEEYFGWRRPAAEPRGVLRRSRRPEDGVFDSQERQLRSNRSRVAERGLAPGTGHYRDCGCCDKAIPSANTH